VYGDSVEETVEENSSVFSLIRMRWLPPARACRAVKLCTNKIPQFLTRGRSANAGCKTCGYPSQCVILIGVSTTDYHLPTHWRRQGGPWGPRPPNGLAKKIFLVKIEGLSSLPPAKSGCACHDNPTGRGYFYQMSNTYTCIAYLIEIRKFCLKNLVHEGVNFEAQNALKPTYEHL